MKGQQQSVDEQNNVAKLSGMLKDSYREVKEFKPGELTEAEELLVKQNNLNPLNYIPLKTIEKNVKAQQKYETMMQKRAEIMSRPKTDPERIELERTESVERFRKDIADRFDGFGYGMFLFIIVGFTWLIAQSHGWPIGIFCLVLMVAVLELGYRLCSHQ